MTRASIAALRIAGAYAAVAALWTLFADDALVLLSGGASQALEWRRVEGWLFVLMSAGFLLVFARRQFKRHARLSDDLSDERAQHRNLVDSANDFAMYLLDLDGRVITWSAGAERSKGWTQDEIAGRHLRTFYTPADAAAGLAEQHLAQARDEGRFAAELVRVRKDGAQFWAHVMIRPLRDEDGAVEGFACVTRDITAQKEAELVMAENEKLFRAIFEQAAVGIAQVAPDGRMLRINAHFCALVGRSGAELRRTTFADFTHPDDLEADLSLVARCLSGELDRFSIEKRYVRPDRSIVWVSLFASLVRDAAGHPAYFVAVASDITRRKAAEASLSSHADQYKLLFAANPLPMLVYDLEDLRIVAVNDTAVSHYGYPRDEFVGMTILELRPAEDRERLIESVEAIRSGARPTTALKQTGVWRHRKRDGSLMSVEIASHVVDFEGRRCELVLANDVTAQKRTEAEIEASRARLAGIIASAFDGIITTDNDQRIIAFNHAAEAMFLSPSDGMIGRQLTELFPKHVRERYQDTINHVLDSGDTSRRIGGTDGGVAQRANGTEFPADMSISQVTTSSGRFITLIVHDSTERRRAEEAIRESRHRLQVAIEAAHLGFWDLDIAAYRIYFSEEWKRLLGYAGEEVGDDASELARHVHPDDVAKLEKFQLKLLAGSAASAETELRFRHKDGGYRDVLVRCTVLRDRDGAPARVIGTNLDLTPMRDSEREVRRLSARILRLQDTERRRIARELHDTTAQNLAALNMNLARLGKTMGRDAAKSAALIEDSIALTDLCVQEIRTLAYLLHPPLLDDLGLDRAVVDYVRGFSTRSGIPVELDMADPIGRLPDEIELSLFRVIQEGLANVARHSACSAASIRLVRTNREIELEITDNGRGIPPDVLSRLRAGSPLGVGVTGMSERLEQIGGRLEIDSRVGATTVRATVPLEL